MFIILIITRVTTHIIAHKSFKQGFNSKAYAKIAAIMQAIDFIIIFKYHILEKE